MHFVWETWTWNRHRRVDLTFDLGHLGVHGVVQLPLIVSSRHVDPNAQRLQERVLYLIQLCPYPRLQIKTAVQQHHSERSDDWGRLELAGSTWHWCTLGGRELQASRAEWYLFVTFQMSCDGDIYLTSTTERLWDKRPPRPSTTLQQDTLIQSDSLWSFCVQSCCFFCFCSGYAYFLLLWLCGSFFLFSVLAECCHALCQLCASLWLFCVCFSFLCLFLLV